MGDLYRIDAATVFCGIGKKRKPDADGQQAQARLKFSLDEDGLITQVEILETPAG